MHIYLKANRVAGYSGFVVYGPANSNFCSVWMVPGTFFDDWDNR